MLDLQMYGTTGYGGVYVLDSSPPVVVDTGMGRHTRWICELLDRWGTQRSEPISILVTHVHLDHAGGVAQLCDAFPNARVYAHSRGAPHLLDPKRLIAGTKQAVGQMWRYYEAPTPLGQDRVVAVADDEMGIRIPDGDRVIASTPPPQFDLDQSREDVAMIAACEPARLCYGHHGHQPFDPTVAVGYDRTLQRFVDDVTAALQEHALEDVIETVAARYGTSDLWGAEKTRAEASLNVRGVAEMRR
jgi:hydroxyacylglutathione hydrolase